MEYWLIGREIDITILNSADIYVLGIPTKLVNITARGYKQVTELYYDLFHINELQY